MTYGLRNVIGAASGDAPTQRKGYFGTLQPLFGAGWGSIKLCPAVFDKDAWTLADVWTYAIGAHLGHTLDFLAAFACYLLLYADGAWLEEAKTWQWGWVSRIVLFNLVCEVVILNFWHYFTYVSSIHDRLVAAGLKYNPENQYEPATGKAGLFTSTTGNLEREITFTTLGWLQSSMWQCLFTHLWACGTLPVYVDFWSYPLYSVFLMWAIAYWREIHFYCAHRGMHPWWDREKGLLDGDIGAFLYRHVHSLHHKSYNPGPWSGLCMHPVEHFLYYTCATLPPLLLSVHPMHFLYTKFHADIAPVGGHDGMDDPGGKGDFHYLHHSKFECNYGVPFPINLDLIFGTWADWETFKSTGELTVGKWAKDQMHEPEDEKRAPLLNKAKIAEASKEWTLEEVANHTSREDCFVVLYGQVLDVTGFISKHPGGEAVLLANGGKDVTEKFERIHKSSGGYDLVAKWLPDGQVGVVARWTGPRPPAKRQGGGCKYPGALFLYPVLALVAAVATGLLSP